MTVDLTHIGYEAVDYDSDTHYEALYDIIRRNNPHPQAEQGRDWKPVEDETFFRETYQVLAPQVMLDDGAVIGCFYIGHADDGSVELDEFYLDHENGDETELELITETLTEAALELAHLYEKRLESTPLVTETDKIALMQAAGFVIIQEDIGYPEGAERAEIYPHVRMHLLRHRDTFQYAPEAGEVPPQPAGQ